MPPVQFSPRTGLSTSRKPREQGFALLVTIVLVSFLVLILVAMATLTRVETQVADNSQNLAKARQNALFALNIAIGELQKAAGPDQRVTATAEVAQSIGKNVKAGNLHWTGVWDSKPTIPDSNNPTATIPNPNYGKNTAWLVSGFRDKTTDAAIAAIPETPITDPGITGVSSTAVRLVGAATADVEYNPITGTPTATTANNGVVVPLEEINATGISGLASTKADGSTAYHTIGRYGYWVGDEGVKARVNIADARVNASTEADKLNRAGTIHRTALEWMREKNTTGADNLSSLIEEKLLPDDDQETKDNKNTRNKARYKQFEKFFLPSQLPFVASSSSNVALMANASRVRYHDISFHSAGVQSDVRLGGLKRDLTAAFEMEDKAFQASSFADAAPTTNRAVNADGTNVSFLFSKDLGNELIYRSPTWPLLRNHYRFYHNTGPLNAQPTLDARSFLPKVGGSVAGTNSYLDIYNGTADSDPKTHDRITKDSNEQATPRPTHPALMPIINRITIVFSLQSEAATDSIGNVVRSPPTPPATEGLPIYNIKIVATPYIILHNPYSINLNFLGGGLLLRGIPFDCLIRANKNIKFTSLTGDNIHKEAVPLLLAGIGGTGGYNNFLRLEIPPTLMPPGELQVFSAPLSTPIPAGQTLTLARGTYYQGGIYFERLNQTSDVFNPYWDKDFDAGGEKKTKDPQPDLFGTKYETVSCPIGINGALIPPTDDNQHHERKIKLLEGMTVEAAILAATKTGDNDKFIARFFVKSPNDDDELFDDSKLHNELYVNGIEVNKTEHTKKESTNYEEIATYFGGNRVQQYTGTPTPLISYDIFVKPANIDARQFVLTNPLSIVTQKSTVGKWADNKDGPPLANAAWAVRYRNLSGKDWGSDVVFDTNDNENGGTLAYWGPSNQFSDGLTSVPLIGVPRSPMTSLAQFQHLNISLYAHEPYYAIGNSEATPYNDPNNIIKRPNDSQDWHIADISYLANQSLWDSFFFSTITSGYTSSGYYTGVDKTDKNSRESIREAWFTGTCNLPNPHIIPYSLTRRPTTQDQADLTEQRQADLTEQRQADLFTPENAAAHLLMRGAFNINSLSENAWVALLGGARTAGIFLADGNVESVGNDAAMPRILPSLEGVRQDSANTAENWNGFAKLTDSQIRNLAQHLVTQIRARQISVGRPFLSLAEFVNRQLTSPASALTAKGPLQIAIDDASINPSDWGTKVDAAMQANFPFPSHGEGNAASMAATYLRQADVLQQIGPLLSARSDTFIIRTFGENINPITNESQGRAWCEAVVQRTPEYVDPASNDPWITPAAGSINAALGRRFKIVSFRWLGSADI